MTFVEALMGLLLFLGATVAAIPAYADAPITPVIPSSQNYSVAVTAYNAVPDQTSSHPLVTASGAYSNPEVVAARSQDMGSQLPFGTIIEIDGPAASQATCGYNVVSPLIGYRVIADTLNARYTDRIDILFSTNANYIMPNATVKNASTILGICNNVSIRVVGFVNISNPNKLPTTQAQLAAIVKSENGLALNTTSPQ